MKKKKKNHVRLKDLHLPHEKVLKGFLTPSIYMILVANLCDAQENY
jgi:hypothetical protein